ncbi:MAG: hypothetical protein K0U39_02325 [Alphaproteobacteria bacterium]|nr:hypothetical protein [Alphaproteobacteria bacterium]
MKKETEPFEPFIDGYYDDEEKELIEAIEEAAGQEGYVPQSIMTPEYKAMMQRAAARNIAKRENR